jgi:hypothetical protein
VLETVCVSERFAFVEYSKEVAVDIPLAFTAPFKVAVALLMFEAKLDAAVAFTVGIVLSTRDRT